jgi:hypothetical protein
MTEELKNPYEILGEGDRKIIYKAEDLIKSGIPDRDLIAQVGTYLTVNAQCQNDLNALRSQVSFTSHKVYVDMKRKEAVLRQNAMDDGFKSNEERGVMSFKNEAWRDMYDRYTSLSIISQRLESLEWILKSLANHYN